MNKTKEVKMTKWSVAAAIVFFVSLMAIDSDSWLPLILCVVSWVWLGIEAWRNGWLWEPEDEE